MLVYFIRKKTLKAGGFRRRAKIDKVMIVTGLLLEKISFISGSRVVWELRCVEAAFCGSCIGELRGSCGLGGYSVVVEVWRVVV